MLFGNDVFLVENYMFLIVDDMFLCGNCMVLFRIDMLLFEHDMFLRLMVPPIGKRKSHLNFISIYFYFKSYNYLFFALKLVLVFVNSV